MTSIIKRLQLKQKSLPITLDLMISLVESEYTDSNLPDLAAFCHVLNETFGTDFTEEDILFSDLSRQEEEDMRLQYKHLNLYLHHD